MFCKKLAGIVKNKYCIPDVKYRFFIVFILFSNGLVRIAERLVNLAKNIVRIVNSIAKHDHKAPRI